MGTRSANRRTARCNAGKGDAPYDNGCTRMETKSINDQNIRGGRIQAPSWLGQAEKKEMPASVTSPDTPAILLDDEAF